MTYLKLIFSIRGKGPTFKINNQISSVNIKNKLEKSVFIVMEPFSRTIVGLQKSGRSPINIEDKVTRVKKFPPLIMSGHWHKNGSATLSNDGQTALIELTGERIQSSLTGGPLLNDQFAFWNAHYHWGESDCNGSEHQINGTWYSMESHVVHLNQKYKNFKQCLKHKDGICILVYFFLVTTDAHLRSNPHMDRIVDNLQFVRQSSSITEIPSNSLHWMRQAIYCPKYYTYFGSYHTRTDPECVTWIVFPLIIPITSYQLNQFRKLNDQNGKPILNNCHKINPPNGRPIYSVIKTFDD